MADLTSAPLFEPLLITKVGDSFIDLHNDHDCEQITHNWEEGTLRFTFNGKHKAVLLFTEVLIAKMTLLPKLTPYSCTLDNFYRGRFEQAGQLQEFSEEGKGYYYLEFTDGDAFELFAQGVFLHLEEV